MSDRARPVRRAGPARCRDGPRRCRGRAGARRRFAAARRRTARRMPAERSPARPRPRLPEVAELDLVRHYTRLSQKNYGVDTGFYPLGSCSMKYNPKVAEAAAALPGLRSASTRCSPTRRSQGTLELLWRLERALCEITGMARATLQPPAGRVRRADRPADHARVPRRRAATPGRRC